MICATCLGDLSDLVKPIGWDLTLRILEAILLLGVVFSAILYGSLLYDSIIGPGSPEFRGGIFRLSIGLAACFFFVGTFVEAWLGKIEG